MDQNERIHSNCSGEIFHLYFYSMNHCPVNFWRNWTRGLYLYSVNTDIFFLFQIKWHYKLKIALHAYNFPLYGTQNCVCVIEWLWLLVFIIIIIHPFFHRSHRVSVKVWVWVWVLMSELSSTEHVNLRKSILCNRTLSLNYHVIESQYFKSFRYWVVHICGNWLCYW